MRATFHRMMSSPSDELLAVEVRNLRVKRGATEVLRDVGLTVERGSTPASWDRRDVEDDADAFDRRYPDRRVRRAHRLG